MKTGVFFIFLLGLSLLVGTPISHAAVLNPTQEKQVESASPTTKKEVRAAQKETRREFRRTLKDTLKQAKESAARGDAEVVLLIIVALLLPPLAMFLFDGEASGRFWISLLFALGAIFLSFLGLGYLAGLSALISIIYTLYIIISESF